MLGFGVERAEVDSESVLEGEIEGLGGEISDNVSQVSSVKGTDTFFFDDSSETVADTGVAGDLTGLDFGVGILGLEE